MSVHRMALLLFARVLFVTSKELTSSNCGPECVGECFAGTCLFKASLDHDLDNEDAILGSQVPAFSASALHGTVHERANPPAMLEANNVKAHVQKTDTTGQLDSKALGLDLRPDMGLPQSRGASAPASGMVPTKAASEFAADLAVPTALQFGKPRSLLASDQVMSQTAVRVQKMKDELAGEEATEDQLQEENVELKTELEQWRVAGAHVADREGKAAEALQQAGVSPSALPPALALAAAATTVAEVSLLSRAVGSMQNLPLLASSSRSFWHAMFAVAACVMLVATWVALEFGTKLSKARPDWQNVVGRAGKVMTPMTPMFRSMGVANFKIQISEIHVGSLLGGGDVHVSVNVGEGAELRSEVVSGGDGSFLRFTEAFVLDMRKGGAPLTLRVVDGRGQLASLQLPAREAISLACSVQGQYYRSELVAEAALSQEYRKPYAAMKLRDVTSEILRADTVSEHELEGAL